MHIGWNSRQKIFTENKLIFSKFKAILKNISVWIVKGELYSFCKPASAKAKKLKIKPNKRLLKISY